MNGTRLIVILAFTLVSAVSTAAICGSPPPQKPQATTSPAAITRPPAPTLAADKTAEIARRVTSFDQFPLVWLGTSFDSDGDGVGDLPLTDAYYEPGEAVINPRTGAVIAPALRTFRLVYGTCQIPPGQNECTNPLDIAIHPADQQLAPVAGGKVRVRGVDATDLGQGALFIETADFAVSIAAPDDQAVGVANQLFGANAKAAGITKASDFGVKTGKPGSAGTSADGASPP